MPKVAFKSSTYIVHSDITSYIHYIIHTYIHTYIHTAVHITGHIRKVHPCLHMGASHCKMAPNMAPKVKFQVIEISTNIGTGRAESKRVLVPIAIPQLQYLCLAIRALQLGACFRLRFYIQKRLAAMGRGHPARSVILRPQSIRYAS